MFWRAEPVTESVSELALPANAALNWAFSVLASTVRFSALEPSALYPRKSTPPKPLTVISETPVISEPFPRITVGSLLFPRLLRLATMDRFSSSVPIMSPEKTSPRSVVLPTVRLSEEVSFRITLPENVSWPFVPPTVILIWSTSPISRLPALSPTALTLSSPVAYSAKRMSSEASIPRTTRFSRPEISSPAIVSFGRIWPAFWSRMSVSTEVKTG